MANEFLNAVTQGAGWVGLRSMQLTSGEISGGDAWNKFAYTQSEGPQYAVDASSASSNATIDGNTSHGVVVQHAGVDKTIDGATGADVVGGASGDKDKASVTLLECLPSQVAAIQAMRTKPVVLSFGHGLNGAGEIGTYYLLGKISALNISEGSGNTLRTIQIEVTGKSYTATTAGDTALGEGPGAVTPVGGTEVTPAVPTDVAEIKAGNLHLVVT